MSGEFFMPSEEPLEPDSLSYQGEDETTDRIMGRTFSDFQFEDGDVEDIIAVIVG